MIRPMSYFLVKVVQMLNDQKSYLTLTRPIGLPPNALVAQKIADQR